MSFDLSEILIPTATAYFRHKSNEEISMSLNS